MKPRSNKPRKGTTHVHHAVHHHAKNHFIPHEGNGFLPHALRHRTLFAYSLVLILLKAAIVILPVALPSAQVLSSAITEANIISLTNQARRNLGLADVTPNHSLTEAAVLKAKDMIANGYFAHTSPSGTTPWYWIKSSGYSYRYAAENLAVHYTEAEGVNEGWLASPTHRANIVNPKYTEIGVGIVQGTFEGYASTLVVQYFGTPQQATGETESTPSTTLARAIEPLTSSTFEETAPTNVAGTGTEGGIVPIVNESSVSIKPTRDGYEIDVLVEHASSVAVYSGASWSPLDKGDETSWSGSITIAEGDSIPAGSPLVLIASNEMNQKVIQPLAIGTSAGTTKDLYMFTQGDVRSTKLFGRFSLFQLEDGVRKFYFYSIVVLITLLLVSIFIKIEIQHRSVIIHTLAVITLAILLTFIT